jgi:hypothetical protein
MKRKRFTEEQIIAVLKEHELGTKTGDLCRKYGISEATFVGQQLSSVTFVMDYWQLSFDGAVLTVYSAVAVRGQDWSVSDRDDQFRNRLCERIGHKVADTEFRAGNCILVRFDDGGTVEVSLREHDYRGPEAIDFRPRNTSQIYVF